MAGKFDQLGRSIPYGALVQALRGLIKEVDPAFLIDYHSFAQLILYPEGWQVETIGEINGRKLAAQVDLGAPEAVARIGVQVRGPATGDARRGFGDLHPGRA